MELYNACKTNNLKLARKLLSDRNIKSSINEGCIMGMTPLHKSSVLGYIRVVRLLVDNGADVNSKDLMLNTPLLYSCNNGYFDVCHFLISRGAKVNIKNNFKFTPLYIAILNGHDDVTKLLLSHKASTIDDSVTSIIKHIKNKHTKELFNKYRDEQLTSINSTINYMRNTLMIPKDITNIIEKMIYN